MFKIEGQLAIISGGANGIGKGICEVFCKAGAKVALWDIDDKGSEVANQISLNGGDIFFQKVDITSLNSVQKAVSKIINDHKKIDILINNAGIIQDRSFIKMKKKEWDTVLEVNLNSLFVTCKAVVPIMKKNGYGRIISSSSINAFQGAFGQTNYAASKAGVSGFTRALCKELGGVGITVNSVAPGLIQTSMTETIPDKIFKKKISEIPVGRIGTPEDVGYTCLFLASKEAGFISGITLHTNGGVMPT